jgi:hypothetical protein
MPIVDCPHCHCQVFITESNGKLVATKEELIRNRRVLTPPKGGVSVFERMAENLHAEPETPNAVLEALSKL